MHIPKRLINLARDKALSSFSALAEKTVVEADTRASRAMASASAAEQTILSQVRAFVRGDGRTLRTRMDRHFASLLERAMLTMHVDQRQKTNEQIDYKTLTLIDDDVVVRQIEVDRLVGRLRDAEPVALGRVNLTIAMMHNDHGARERENPFRPFLLARALHDGLRETIWDEAQSKILFDALGMAMASCLPGFYAGILDVFESGGITPRLVARPSAMSQVERDRLAWQTAAQQLHAGDGPGQWAPPARTAGDGSGSAAGSGSTGGSAADPQLALQQRMIPKLERLRDIESSSRQLSTQREQELVDLIWNMFHQPKGARAPRQPPPAQAQLALMEETRPQLDAELFALQNKVSAGMAAPAPLALRALLAAADTSAEQQQTMDIVALLFESMVHDAMLSGPTQAHLGRLFIPFVRAALQTPALLHDSQHPARRLVDRLGSVGVAISPSNPSYKALDFELRNIIGAVLELFDDDASIFSDAESALDTHVSSLLAALDPRIARCCEAVAEAAGASARLANAGASLSAVLQPLDVDPRLADFILGTWARVLSHPHCAQANIELLPELLWSAQAKTDPADRSALMKLLPDLVRRVREGMAEISLPEGPSKAAFDRLVAVHMDVLGNKQAAARKHMTLEQFRQHFANFQLGAGNPSGDTAEAWIGKFELEAALARRKVAATVNARAAARLPQRSDAEWLSIARPGTAFEIKAEDLYYSALLCAVSPDNVAWMFTLADQPAQAVYLRAPLLEALESGAVRPLEHAPLFERAVESLVAGAESLSSETRFGPA